MASESFPKGYLLSSTPLQSPEDSGYFGSCYKRYKSNANVLNSCSPVKESKNLPERFSSKREFCEISPSIKFDKNLDFVNSIKNESASGIEINELSELEFTNSNFSSKNEQHKISLPAFEPEQKFHDALYNSSAQYSLSSLSEDSDIKFKFFEHEQSDFISSNEFEFSKSLSNELPVSLRDCRKYDLNYETTSKEMKIDFIHELKKRNCLSIISFILSCLSSKELCDAFHVNKEWKEVILFDSKANSRREKFITERFLFLNGPSKENRLGMRHGPSREHKLAFSDITNVTVPNSVKSKFSNTRFDSFVKAAKSANSKLLKCPRCSYASKCSGGNNYLCTHCSYNFCCHCLDPVLENHSCFKPQLPNIIIGSKRSKRNLKRL